MINITDSSKEFDATRTSQTASSMLKRGDVLAARYRIDKIIGVGAMGAVYRAHDIRLDIMVAVKILHIAMAENEEALRRFESELKLARQISHPNIVRIHDIGEHEKLTFLSMDLIEGQSLEDVINSDNALEPERAARIAADIAHGLAAAHAQGVVHRDLKPANILIDANDNAIITDFGVALSMTAARKTQTGFFVGTPDYLAPEQTRGGKIDGRADIYALGLILYEMLTGTAPFANSSLDELLAQRTLGRQPDLTRSGVMAPVYLRRVISRCLAKSPDERYQTATLLADDLTAKDVSRRLGGRTKKIGLATLAALAVIGLGFLLLPREGDSSLPAAAVAAASPTTTIAILPFLEQPPDPALSWVSTSITESLAIELGASDSIALVEKQRIYDALTGLHIGAGPPTSDVSMQLAKLYSADWLITGVVENNNGQIVVRTQVIPANGTLTGKAIRDSKVNLSAVIDTSIDLASQIREILLVPKPDWEPSRLSNNMEALRAYATGVALLDSGSSIDSLEPLEKAVAIDPGFAVAWIKLSQSYEELGRTKDATNAANRAIAESGNDTNIVGLARVRLATINGEFDQAKEILRQSLESQPADHASRFMLAELNGEQGHYGIAIDMLESIVASDPTHPRAWYLLAKYTIQNGDSQLALNKYLVTALSIQEKLNNAQGKADVLNAMGIAQHRLGQLEEAESSYMESALIRESIGDIRGFGSSLRNLARIELQLGNYAKARKNLDRAIVVGTSLEDMTGLAEVHNVYGTLEEEVSDYKAALRSFRQALKIREDMGDEHALSNSFNNIGFAYFMLGEYDNAGVYWQRALDQSTQMGNPDAQMQARQGLGQLRLAQGQWNEAAALFLTSLKTSRELRFPEAEAVALGNLGRVAQRQGRMKAAITSYSEALTVLEELNDMRGTIEFKISRAEAWLEIGALDAASKDIDACMEILEQSKNPEQRAFVNLLKGELSFLQNNDLSAKNAFDAARKAAAQTGSDLPALYLSISSARYGQEFTDQEMMGLLETAEDIGNADLQMRAMFVLASDALENGDIETAQQRVNDLLFKLRNHEPYSRSWLFHNLAYKIFKQSGDKEAAENASRVATEDAQRMLANVPDSAVAAFKQKLQNYQVVLP